MSLNFDVTKIDDYQNKFPPRKDGDKRLWNIYTESLVWMMILIGMTRIEENNVDEVVIRIRMAEKIYGLFFLSEGKYIPFPAPAVRGHIGLSTNVSPQSKHVFEKKLVHQLRSDITEKLNG